MTSERFRFEKTSAIVSWAHSTGAIPILKEIGVPIFEGAGARFEDVRKALLEIHRIEFLFVVRREKLAGQNVRANERVLASDSSDNHSPDHVPAKTEFVRGMVVRGMKAAGRETFAFLCVSLKLFFGL